MQKVHLIISPLQVPSLRWRKDYAAATLKYFGVEDLGPAEGAIPPMCGFHNRYVLSVKIQFQ